MKILFQKLKILIILSLFLITYAEANYNTTISTGFQDTTKLKTTNGKIVGIQKLKSIPKFANIDIYKIQYMSDGLKVVGFITKNKDNTQRPTLIFNRGGNREFGKIKKGKGYNIGYLAFLASNGYTVLATQYRGNDGGEGNEEFGGKDINDVLNLIKMSNSLPFANEKKIFMLGVSRGGMMTYLALKEQAPIKAAVVIGAPTDLEYQYNNRNRKYKNVIETLIGNNRNEWKERSAIYWADKINVPLLILQGSEDNRVSPKHAQFLAKKLDEHKKVYKLKIIDGGNHGLTNKRGKRNKFMFNWFEQYLNQQENTIQILVEDSVFKKGQVAFNVEPNDILKIIKRKICKSGKPCWKVKRESDGKIGFVYPDKMQNKHKVFFQ